MEYAALYDSERREWSVIARDVRSGDKYWTVYQSSINSQTIAETLVDGLQLREKANE